MTEGAICECRMALFMKGYMLVRLKTEMRFCEDRSFRSFRYRDDGTFAV